MDAVEDFEFAGGDLVHIPLLEQEDVFVALILLENAVERRGPFAQNGADLGAGFAVAVLYALRDLGHIIDHDIRDKHVFLPQEQFCLGQLGDV